MSSASNGLKLTVVGGGSTYTPELIAGFSNNSARLPVAEVVLLDPDPERLEVVGGMARRMLDRMDWTGALTLTDDPRAAIESADFVLLQLRVGGQAARLLDETLPPKFGLIGQETTGVGGFAKALRTVPVVLDLADLVHQHASSTAWIVDFTNPVGVVTQALLDQGNRALGLCNVAIGFQRQFAKQFGVAPDRVAVNQVGLNHLTWIREVLVDGHDRLPEILEQQADELGTLVGSDGDKLRTLRAIPSYYLRYYYREAAMVAAAPSPTRAEKVMDLEQELLALYRDPNLTEKPKLLESRGGAFYSEAAVQLIASLHDGRGDVQVVDVANHGTLGDLSPASVIEVPARIDRDGAHPLTQKPLDSESANLVRQVKDYELLAAEAARTGDRQIALEALRTNPLSGPPDRADDLLAAVLEANRGWLPRFFPS